MNIKIRRQIESILDDEYLRELAMPAPFEDSADDLYDRLSRYELNPQDIAYNPKESFAIISSEREPKGVFGYVLFDNRPFPSANSENTRFHRLSFIEMVAGLYDEDWLTETFHAIFHRIIKHETKKDAEVRDVVWCDYNGEPFVTIMDKTYDLSCNMFMIEAQKIANFINKAVNAPSE